PEQILELGEHRPRIGSPAERELGPASLGDRLLGRLGEQLRPARVHRLQRVENLESMYGGPRAQRTRLLSLTLSETFARSPPVGVKATVTASRTLPAASRFSF